MERIFNSYYSMVALVKMVANGGKMKKAQIIHYEGMKRGKKMTAIEGFKLMLQHSEKQICDLFLDAVNRNDADKILEIAETVRFFKEHQKGFADPQRRWLIYLKQRLEACNETMTVSEVANSLQLKNTDDGFSALRRKCKEINFPLSTPRKTSRK
jgi:hypothetical protein